MTCTPEQLAREVRDALDGGLPLLHREDRQQRRERAEAALAELQAQAEAGLTIAEHYDEIPWFRSLAAAAPSPADQEEA